MANRRLIIFSFIVSLYHRVRGGKVRGGKNRPHNVQGGSRGSSIRAFLGLSIGMALLGLGPAATPSMAQSIQGNSIQGDSIQVDRTLETPSQSVSVGSRNLIQGGVIQGSNLFHSFLEFNVDEGQQVYFANPTGIDNILSRVTGSDRTNILGTLGVEGPANLFLLNPNGIFFGPNAQLDLSGSFMASTANQLNFQDGSFFSALPSQQSLLTVSTPLGLQHGSPQTAQQIAFGGRQINVIDQSVMTAATLNAGEIRVSERALEAISGDHTLLFSATDNIELQDLADNNLDLQPGSGKILFTADSDGNGEGSFTMTATEDTLRTFGRDIAIAGARLQVSNITTATHPTQDAGQSLNTARALGQPSGPALTTLSGQLSHPTDVDLYEIYLSGTEPFSASTVATNPANAANTPNTQLFLFDATGQGLYGNDNALDCNCRQSTLNPSTSLPAGRYYLGVASYATEPASTEGAIFPDSFETLNFNALETPTGPGQNAPLSQWNSQQGIEIGDYNITLAGVRGIANQVAEMPLTDSGNISLIATHGNIRNGQLTTSATRSGGDITLNALSGSLDITNTLNTLGGQGNGGQVSLQSTGDIQFRPGASVLTRGQLGGDLRIQSDRDIVVQGGLLSQQSTTTNPSNGELGGGFNIQGRSLLLQDGAQILSETLGSVALKNSVVEVTEEVFLGGFGAVNLFNPFGVLATQVGAIATGEGGDLTLNIGTLRVNDAAVVATRSFGRGNAGDLTVRGNEVVVSGAVKIENDLLLAIGESTFESELSTEAENEDGELLFQGGIVNTDPFSLVEANAGDLTIEVDRLLVQNGGEVAAGTHSVGDGGNFTLIADEVIVTGQQVGESSELGTETVPEFLGARPPEGNAGRLVIVSDRLIVTEGGKIGAESLALGGNAGEIEITAREIEVGGGFVYDGEINTSSINSEVKNAAEEELQGDTTRDFGGQGGSVNITAEQILLRDGGQISARTEGNGDAGNVTIAAPMIDITGSFTPTVDLAADLTADLAADSTGIANDAITSSGRISSGVFASSEVDGQAAGNIQITANEQLRLSNLATIEASTRGDQGNIFIGGNAVVLSNGSQITTNAAGTSTGGNITFDLNFLIAAPSFGNNDITANAEDGSGGQIRINTRSPILGFQVGNGDTFRRNNLTPTETATNDITAFSRFNPTIDDGTVTIEPPETDPAESLVEPPALADASDRIATGCAAQQGNRFTVSSQGGLPSDPRRGLRSSAIAHDFRLEADPSANHSANHRDNHRADAPSVYREVNPEVHSNNVTLTEPSQRESIVEAQGFVQAPDGTLSLITSANHHFSPDHRSSNSSLNTALNSSSNNSSNTSLSCHRP